MAERIRYIDSHTGGEPTRVALEGFPGLGDLPLKARVEALRSKHDRYRAALATEPRASDVVVGAYLMPPVEAGSVASVIYFNNAGYLGMCGHGTIGVVETLRYLGRIGPGTHRLDTPVGTVACTLAADGAVSIENVVSYRHRKDVEVDVAGHGRVKGDVAWGGNWFFLVDAHDRDLRLDRVSELTAYTSAVRRALGAQGVTGKDGAEIDHIELYGDPSKADYDCRNFVLCPGLAYDRSPCGTGTSARLACLAADGELAEGATWRQASIVGSVFEGAYRKSPGGIIPRITGRAYVCGEGTAILDPTDPFCWGIEMVEMGSG
jgi:4-hydroxyproline epimerase